jgi:hypothetical protein
MPYLLVEYRFDPPVTAEQLTTATIALGDCLKVRGIEKLRSWVATDRRRGICEYRAADAESVRDAYRAAGVACSAIWPATLFEPGRTADEG